MQIRSSARAFAFVTLLAAASAWGCVVMPAQATPVVSPLPASDYGTRALCGAPLPGSAGCLALALVPKTAAARAHTHPLAMTSRQPIRAAEAAAGAYGFRPQDLHSGYALPTAQLEPQTNPQTIAIVDAYDDAHAEADLEVYDQEFGLPACTHANGCFTKVNQYGQAAPLPDSSSEEARGWAGEIATDVEVAHAICQDCHILLVEATSAANVNLNVAENRAAAMGATEISDSWGGPESLGESPTPFEHSGIVITASAGDNGYLDWNNEVSSERGLADFPATSPAVIAVGGTRLILNPGGGSWQEESVWNGKGAGGGGCSTLYAAASWQPSAAVGCGSKRASTDVSADADPYTGVAVYDSTPAPPENLAGWATIGGTSVASPIIAATFALAGGAHGIAHPAETLYANLTASPGALHDITTGSNGPCTKAYNSEGVAGCTTAEEAAACAAKAICKAVVGYDGPSGVGTPIGIAAFQPTSGQHTGTGEGEKEPPGGHEGGGAPEGGNTLEQELEAILRAGGGGSGNGVPGAGGSAPSVGSAPPTGPPSLSLSNLSLMVSAVAALNHAHPKVSQIAFSFTLSLPAKVRITLAKQGRVRGHTRWRAVPGSFTLAAPAGLDRVHLKSHRRLTSGRYLLTCAPVHATARTLTLVIG